MLDIRRISLPVLFSGAFLIAPLLIGAGAAHATEYGTQTMEQPAAADIDDATLDRFVDAFIAVRAIHEDFSAQLETVSDEAAAQQLQQEAQEQMVHAVQDEGISIDDYNAIGMMLQSDPSLLDQVQEMAEERM